MATDAGEQMIPLNQFMQFAGTSCIHAGLALFTRLTIVHRTFCQHFYDIPTACLLLSLRALLILDNIVSITCVLQYVTLVRLCGIP